MQREYVNGSFLTWEYGPEDRRAGAPDEEEAAVLHDQRPEPLLEFLRIGTGDGLLGSSSSSGRGGRVHRILRPLAFYLEIVTRRH